MNYEKNCKIRLLYKKTEAITKNGLIPQTAGALMAAIERAMGPTD